MEWIDIYNVPSLKDKKMNNRSIWTTNLIENKYDKNSFAYVKAENSLNTKHKQYVERNLSKSAKRPLYCSLFQDTLGHQLKIKYF